MKKQFFAGAMAAVMALSMAACGGNGAAATTAAASKAEETTAAAESQSGEAKKAEVSFETIKPGKLVIGTSPDFAPYEFYHIEKDGEPKLAGFDIAFAQKMADDFGLEVEFATMDFDGILMELQNGSIDLGISGFSPDPERQKVFDFSDIYYKGGQSFCVSKKNLDKYKGFEDFKGLAVGAQTGSIQYGLAEKNTPDANIIGLPKVTDIVSELTTGKLEGAFMETAVAEQYAKNYPDLAIAWEVPYDTEGSAVAVKKGNQALLDAVNAEIKALQADGSLDKFVTEAQELASDDANVYQGQLDENGKVKAEAEGETADAAETTEAAAETTKAQ